MFGLIVLPLLAAAIAVPISVPAQGARKPGLRIVVALIRQDFSDCTNSTVQPGPGAGGEVLVYRQGNGTTEVNVRLTRGTPNTTYHFFLKCVRILGDIKTNAAGRGNNTFIFQTSSVGSVYAFDMYPEGAPLGNKFQSVQVKYQ